MASRRLIALLCVLAFASCSRSNVTWGTPGEARIAFLGDVWTLNPLFAFQQRLIDLTQLTTQPLVGIGPDNRAIALLCTDVPSVANGGVSRDATTITYHLRRNVRFADGVPFTSRDVAFTYRAIEDPRNPVTESAPYARIASLSTPNPYTVVIKLKSPWSGAVRELFAASDFIYGIVRWVRGDGITYEPNPYAWQPPKLKRLIVSIVPDENAALIALRSHRVDFTDLTYTQVLQTQGDAAIQLLAVPRNAVDMLELQTQTHAMHDVRAREAIAYAIDRAAMARSVYHGLAPLATTEVPPLFAEHDRAITAPPHDANKGRALFSAAGARGSVRIVYPNSRDDFREDATIVQNDLRAAGIDATIKGYVPSVFYAPAAQGGTLYNGTFEIAVTSWYGGLDPETSEYWQCANRAPAGPNTARWCDTTYDAAFGAQQRSIDATVRARAFATMQKRLHDETVAVFLVYRTEYEALNPGLRGVQPNMLYNFGQTEAWSR
jgi:peptide/nickel transport system substrate-binding protein